MVEQPAVTILLPVYNGETYLKAAVDSVLGQTLPNWELLIINDGSTDDSQTIIDEFKDQRIRVLKQENRGLIATLNRGIAESRGELIARIDCDDEYLPEKLRHQVAFLENHPAVVALGTSFDVISSSGETVLTEWLLPQDNDLRRNLYWRNPFAHGSVMMRKTALENAGGYDPGYKHVEDYDLWRKLARQGELAGLGEVLYKWRANPQGVSRRNSREQSRTRNQILQQIWVEPLPNLSRREYKRRLEELKRSHPTLARRYAELQLHLVLSAWRHGKLLTALKTKWLLLTDGYSLIVALRYVLGQTYFWLRHAKNLVLGTTAR